MQHPEMPVCIQLNTLRHPKADDQTDTQTKNTQAEGGGDTSFSNRPETRLRSVCGVSHALAELSVVFAAC